MTTDTPLDDVTLISTPAGFIEKVLGMPLYWWQFKVVQWFENTRQLVKGALSTPNGAGKSARVVAGLVLWWLFVHPKGRVVITTKDSKQLDHQIWPALLAHKAKFEAMGWRFIEREIHTPTGGFLIGFTTDDPGRAEGWHKVDDIDGPLLIVADEAKSVDEDIFMALDRCTYNALLLTSSPGLDEGRFYEAHTTLGKSDTNPNGFNHLQVGLNDCPHIPKERIDNIIATYGIDHPFTRSTLFGEFMDKDAESIYVIQKSWVKNCMERPPMYVRGGEAAFCDFAAGTAENVIGHRQGNKVDLVCWRDPNPMSAIGRCLVEFNKWGLTPSQTYGDEGGIGIPIVARFTEMGWPLIGVNNDDPPNNPIYENRGAEMWYEGGKKLMSQEVIAPNDPILFKQLTTRRMKFTSDGKLGVESKKDMAKRKIESPDRADAFLGSLATETELASVLFDERGLKRLEAYARIFKAEIATLVDTGQAIEFDPHAQKDKAWLEVWERPIAGERYLCVVNPMPHDDLHGDHVVIILKAGSPIRLVAKVRKPCRLDGGPLAEFVSMLTKWYGRCMCIPIVNDRGDVVDHLLNNGVSLYAQEEFERLRHGRTEQGLVFGWKTDDYTRSMWIGALSEAIRTDLLEIGPLTTVMQLMQLSIGNHKSKREAEALGVGVCKISYASSYTPPRNPMFKSERRANTSRAMLS